MSNIISFMPWASLESWKTYSPDSTHQLAFIAGLMGIVVISLFGLPSLIEVSRYVQFTLDHDTFHRNAAEKFRGRVLSWMKAPWSSATTYYLSDSEAIKRMFTPSQALDARALADLLHYVVWDVKPGPEISAADRAVHTAMAKSKLGPMVEEFERLATAYLTKLSDSLGSTGKSMPLHHMGYRIMYDNTVPAVLGERYPVEESRLQNQRLADAMQSLNLASMLPVLPTAVWNKIIPSARRGVAARDALRIAISRWEEEDGVQAASEVFKSIFTALQATGASPAQRHKWINMVQFGFLGNTGESLGWILVWLLQSPVLLATVKAEVAKLPSGPIGHLDIKERCPYLSSAIWETLRFAGSVFVGRRATVDVKIPGIDKTFEKGNIIRAMTRTGAFDTKVWGEDAKFYRGNRFVTDDSLTRHVQTFGGGVSACPGRHFAIQELLIMVALTFRHFEFGPISFHEKNRPEDPIDTIKREAAPTKSQIIDMDGKYISISEPGFDINSGVEAVSGLLLPRLEPVALLTPVAL